MTIRNLTFTIEPHYQMPGLVTFKWKIEDGSKELNYSHTLWYESPIQENDFKSMWDHIWEKAKYEIEREVLEVKPT